MGRGERQHIEAETAVSDAPPGHNKGVTGVPPVTKESPFDVVERVGDVAVFRDGPKPRGPADRHGTIDVGGERIAVFVQTGPAWPMSAVLDRGRAILELAHTKHRNIARAFWFDATRNKYHYVVERGGGVALPALVRRIRKRDGAMPPVTCARIARDFVRAQEFVDTKIARARFRTVAAVAAIVADTVVSWEGRVVIAPRLFGTPADAPPWLHRNTFVEAIGALLLALLAPAVEGDVDASILRMLADNARLKDTGVAQLEDLATRALYAPPVPRRRGRQPPPAPASLSPSDLAVQLDEIVRALGGDDESFAAALMNELFPERKRADLAWREEMQAVPLSST